MKDTERNTYGLDNPLADVPCGVLDREAKLPSPVHYDCKECRLLVEEVLLLRVPYVPRGSAKEQPKLFDDLTPVKKTRRRKGNS